MKMKKKKEEMKKKKCQEFGIYAAYF